MDRTELAWAAGFWDGEGSAWLSRPEGRNRAYPSARINQSSTTGVPEVLLRFRRAVAVGRVQGPELTEGREPLYKWVVSSREEVRSTFLALRQWLGETKRTQFRQTLGLTPHRSDEPHFNSRDEWIAWCAGLFDGEGSTCLVKHGSHPGYFVLEANITQSSWQGTPEVLDRFQETFTIGAIYGPYPGSHGHAPVYRWRAYRRPQIEAMIGLMGPNLGQVKRRQATDAFQVIAAQTPLPRGNPAWGNRKTHCVNGHEYATARIRPYKGRGRNAEAPRASRFCLVCLREYAARKRRERGTKERRTSSRRS